MNLYQRINAIMETMGAVGKDGKTTSGSIFEYHKIDDIDDKLRDALVKHGVTAVPTKISNNKVQSIEQADRYGNPRLLWYAECEVTILLINADQPSETLEISGWGHGIDFSDKATSKAIAYGVKAAYLNTFHLRGQPDNEVDDITVGNKVLAETVDEDVENELEKYRKKISAAESLEALADVGLELSAESKEVGDGVRSFYAARMELLKTLEK